MLVHVVTSANASMYKEELRALFSIRHKIYVEEKGWRDPSPDGLEKDEFDTEDAAYLIGIEDDRIICGGRFITTDRPHLLSEVFGNLCNWYGVIRAPMVAEWTRGFIVPDRREGGGIRLRAQCVAAVVDYCMQEGISEVGGIQEIYWLPLWRRLGFDVRVVGDQSKIGPDFCVPAFFRTTEAALASARRWGQLEGSNLIHQGPVKRLIQPHVAHRRAA